MRVLSLSLDNLILDRQSPVAERIIEYGNLAEKYIVIVPGKQSQEIDLSPRAKAFCLGGISKISQLFKSCKLARKLCREYNFDIITVQDQYFLALLGWRLSRKFKIGLEIQIHGFEKFFGLRKVIAEFTIPRAQAIRVVSERLKKRLIDEFGIEEKMITVVPIFIPTTHNTQPITRNANKFVFLTIGRLVPVKNIKLQIKALSEVVKKYKNIELLIVGNGEERKKLKNLCDELCVTGYVKFFGRQEDLDKFYKQADVFLLTSDYEGWGMVVIEAAAYGLPIIMTDVGCAGELIETEKSGLVIPVGDQEKLEQAMARLISDKNLRVILGQGARTVISRLPGKAETLELYKKSWETARDNKFKSK